jgi:hypothetical protein
MDLEFDWIRLYEGDDLIKGDDTRKTYCDERIDSKSIVNGFKFIEEFQDMCHNKSYTITENKNEINQVNNQLNSIINDKNNEEYINYTKVYDINPRNESENNNLRIYLVEFQDDYYDFECCVLTSKTFLSNKMNYLILGARCSHAYLSSNLFNYDNSDGSFDDRIITKTIKEKINTEFNNKTELLDELLINVSEIYLKMCDNKYH